MWKRVLAVWMMLVFAVGIAGCADVEEPFGISGYVVKQDGDRVLVTDPVGKQYEEMFYDAVWVKTADASIKVGQMVGVYFDGPILTSYPGRGAAKSITVIPQEKPAGARMTPEEAVAAALAGAAEWYVPVVREVKFVEPGSWDVTLMEAVGERRREVVTFRVSDAAGKLFED